MKAAAVIRRVLYHLIAWVPIILSDRAQITEHEEAQAAHPV
jgi:hypothetical protein